MCLGEGLIAKSGCQDGEPGADAGRGGTGDRAVAPDRADLLRTYPASPGQSPPRLSGFKFKFILGLLVFRALT